MKALYYILILFFCALVSTTTLAQENKKIKIEYFGFTIKDSLSPKGATTFVRDNSQQIHVVHEGINIWCDKAIYYQKDNFIEAFSNVKMKQGDTINMNAKYAEYSGKTQIAFASGDVILTEPQSTLTTDTLYFDRTKQQAYYKSKGKVVRDSSGTITSQIGRYYMNAKKYQFVKDVVLVNPEYTLNTNQLDFYTETGNAYMFGPSTIVGETSKIYCERGFYDTNNDIGYFIKNSKINYDNRIVEGDSLYFDRNKSFASATNNIKVTDTINNSIIKGHYAEVFRAKDSVFITKRALAITVQEKDSVYLHSDKIMVTGKPEHRITRAYYNAKLYKSDISGKADSIHADHKTGITKLINLARLSSTDIFATKRKPILWNLGNQMSGDTIHLISNTKTEELDSLKVFYDAFLISKDTLGDGYNQVKGRELIGLFKNNELYNVDIIKNAEVIYFSRDDKQELVGINKSKSGSINLKIFENNIDEIRLINQVDGNLYPESKFPKNVRKFKGFDWREEERPKSVEDLFNDDPPLNLPVIKGLADYVPQEEFFDDELLDRVEAAGDKTSKEENKAARNIPQKIKDTKKKKDAARKSKITKKLIKPLKKEN
ncbi:OstA-like protein [Ichthyenterobacterium magnum]|uniref:OstA-like protein n=1 Tax=Ichthyenterobacterium magnum TaxID=1230530 RepID=A0A420DGX9_9FLAO|nr:OstA-like protein [Ichthyenterobacterium magnum]RKE92343.1 OstA-like protein [Ichthyenterobacterium magnum]